ncbi:putative transmembrane protein [Lysobacter dokdonensis DS-58]|uniref:Putative transmembrane protein n=1 Tax=Lysobacter dokdonensis DS-58 TaxID=1300345 RepID=A0A0A2X2R8_9GAMM|nr:tetratricopeptide repeat protein [Lysobacter dokdonensis]KGQ19524.1 putative transmembrane protein [Lysobacter dokdonensis DS-58]
MPQLRPSFTFPLLLAVALAGCTAAGPRETPAAQTRVDAVRSPIEGTMAGEFALQAGQLDQAARWYLDAAKATDDPGLAERATRIALLANNDKQAAEGLALWKQRAPGSLAAHAAEATLALRRNDVRLAKQELRLLLTDKGDIGWRHALAALGAGGRDPKLSGKLLGEFVDEQAIPNKLQAWLAFGGLAMRLEQPALAERIIDRIVQQFPNEPRVALLRASQLREAGKTAEARQVLGGIAQTAYADEEMRMSIAAEYDAMGDSAQAADVLAKGPQDDRSYGLRAALLSRADDDAALGKLYDELKKESAKPDPDRRLLLGQVAEMLERFPEALEWYRSVPGGEARWTARLREANVLHELKRAPEAYTALRGLQSDATVDEGTRRDAYLLEAELRGKDNQLVEELDVFARGLAAYPDDPVILYSRALTWERRDDIPRAEADFRRILVAEPDNVTALNALGYTLADRTNRFAEALELIDRARAAEPDSAAIIDSYGWVLYRLGRKEEALVELRRAFSMQKDPEIASHLAEVLWMLGQKDEARRYFDEAKKLDPENRSLKRALETTGA